jgi:hypothetical protein
MANIFTTINSYGEQAMIGGSQKILEFNIFDEVTRLPVDIIGATIVWMMCNYGEDIAILTKNGNIVDTNVCQIILSPADTANLNGKFQYQLIITDDEAVIHRPGQGLLTIAKGIKAS